MDSMPPTPPPSPDDLRLIVTIYHQVGAYFGWLVTTGIVLLAGLIWRASGERQSTVSSIKDHRERLDVQASRIYALEQGAAVLAAKISELPTRNELSAQTAALDARFDRLDQRLDSAMAHSPRSA